MNNPDLQRRMKSIRSIERKISPDPAWVVRNRVVLLSEVARTMPTASLSLFQKTRQALRHVLSIRVLQVMKGPALAALSVFGVVVSGSLFSVSAAENSIPGDFLYSVKLATEQTRLILTKTQTEKVKLKTEFVERRVQEIKTIVSSDVHQKPERIKEAAEILKRDFDTVKTQLNEATQTESVQKVAQAAKLVDRKTTEAISALKDVRTTVPMETLAKLAEAEAAGVTTGVKAVQVLIGSQNDPEAQGVMSNAELAQSLNSKVQGIETGIVDVTQKLLNTTGTSALLAPQGSATGTGSLSGAGSTSSSLTLLKSAQVSLDQTRQLIQENKLTDVTSMLVEAAKVVTNAETVVQAIAAVSSTAGLPPVGGASSTSSLTSPNASSTSPVTASSTTAATSTSTHSSSTTTSSPP